MAKVHDRILELVFVADDSAETVVVSAVNYYRSEAEFAASNPFVMTFTQTSPNTTGTDLVLGELLPPPTKIRLTFTVQA